MPFVAQMTGAATDRVVILPQEGLRLVNRIGLVPPDQGQFDQAALDKKLGESDLTTGERFELKGHLRNAGLLPGGGKPVSNAKL
jgi:hypothetical protein